MKKTLILIFTLVLGIGFVLGDLSWVYAAAGAEEEFTLEEITVTAQKREENLQKVGITMEVIGGDTIKELGRTDMDQILSGFSSATIQRSVEGLRIGIRGVTFDTPAGYGDGTGATTATVAVNLDGVYTARRPTGTGLYDIERVEVLVGPQSTMYAAPSPGGVINVLMGKPKTDKYELAGTLEYGNFNLLHGEGVVNAPINDKNALRGAFSYQVRDGYLSNGTDDDDSKSGRLRYMWKPSENFSIIATGEYETSINRMMSTVTGFINPGDKSNPWYTATAVTGMPTVNKKNKYYGNIEWDLGIGTLSIIPSSSSETYYRTSTSTSSSTGITTFSISQGDGWERAIEARINSPSASKIVWIVGFNYYKGAIYRDQIGTPSSGSPTETQYHKLDQTSAFMGNITFPLSDTFRGIVGGRWSKDRAASDRYIILGSGVNIASDMRTSRPDYKFGIEWDFAENSMFYANWSTSYRVEQEAMLWDKTTIPPQVLIAYQIGAKNRLFNNKLQLNTSAYYYDYTNRVYQAMQTAYVSTTNRKIEKTYADYAADLLLPPAARTTTTTSDEGGRIPGDYYVYGADIQANWIVSNQDRLDISVSYMKAWITNMHAHWEFQQQAYSSQTDFSDRENTFSPEWTISWDYSHNFNLANGGMITARIDSKFQTKYLIDWWNNRPYSPGVGLQAIYPDQTSWITQEAHHIDNASLVYAHPDGQWTFTGYVKNIFNYPEKRSGGRSSMTIGPPKTYGIIMSVRY